MKKYLKSLLILLALFAVSNRSIGQSKSSSAEDAEIEQLLKLGMKSYQSNSDSAIIYSKAAIRLAKDRQQPKYISKGYKSLGQTYRYANRQKEAIEAYLKAIEYAKKTDDKAEIARIQPLIAHSYAAESDFEAAMKWQKMAKKYAEDNQDTLLIANTSLDIGVIHARKGEFYIAIEYFFKSIDYYEAIGEMKFIIPLLTNIGSIYADIEEYEKSIIYYEKAKNKANKSQGISPEHLAILNVGLGRSYLNLKKYDAAIKNFELGLAKVENTENISLTAPIYNQLGVAYLEQNDLDKARFYYNKSYELIKDANLREEFAATLRGLAKVYQKENKPKLALSYIERANALNEEINNLDDIMIDYKILSTIHSRLGNTEKAYDYLLKHIELKDSINKINSAAEIILLESKYNYKQEELKLTNEVKSLKKDKILQQSRTTVLILALAIISLILATLFWFFNRKKQENTLLRKNLKNKAIIEQQSKELQILNNALETKVKERTAELQTANKYLEQANYELRTFNYIASHDIKEPIRVIGGYAGLIFKKLPTDLKENLGEYFDTIKRSTTQLYTLIEDFASYTTMSKNETIEKQVVDLNLLVANVVENLQETIEKYNGSVEISDLPTIQSSNSLLFTTLKNLVENGLKYNQSEAPTVKIAYQKNENMHQITVSDNGIGIEKQYHEQIFEMFKRLHNRGAYEGSGIGLAIVKLSVEKMGGTVSLESETGQGSRFVIELPML